MVGTEGNSVKCLHEQIDGCLGESACKGWDKSLKVRG